MGVHTVSSRELNQDVGRAKRAAEDGPVVITDRGRPSHVLLSWIGIPPSERWSAQPGACFGSTEVCRILRSSPRNLG